MKYTFGDLLIGDLFNTKSARWVKTSETEAIVVLSAMNRLGEIHKIPLDQGIILLYSSILRSES